jgi:stage II sporulation protein B
MLDNSRLTFYITCARVSIQTNRGCEEVARKKKMHKPKVRIHELKKNKRKDEQAATAENINKSLGSLHNISKHSGIWKNRENRNLFKPFMIAVISALMIGSLFGVLMLRMFVTVDGPEVAGNNNPAAVNIDEEEEQNKEEASEKMLQSVEFASINAYVLQAGIFSERANAETEAADFAAENTPVMVWPRDDQYFLFAGVEKSAEAAAQDASKLETEEFELYSKTWDTPAFELSITPEEEAWLESYLTWWDDALTSPETEETADGLVQLTASFSDESNQLTPLYEKMAAMENNNEVTDIDLLELWYAYASLQE